jgi:hypothetical protein
MGLLPVPNGMATTKCSWYGYQKTEEFLEMNAKADFLYRKGSKAPLQGPEPAELM